MKNLSNYNPKVTISIVSHGQGILVENLLTSLFSNIPSESEVILTLNIPENEEYLQAHKDKIRIIRNKSKKGFGENHNYAFKISSGDLFVIVNPDILLDELNWNHILDSISDPTVAACSPKVLSSNLAIQDNARYFPTFFGLAFRFLTRRQKSNYDYCDQPIHVDWVAGMFIVFKSNAFKMIGGFDERYFMYLEDADICRRLSAIGFKILLDPRTFVIHDARRASFSSFQHLRWHLKSALRFIFLPYKS